LPQLDESSLVSVQIPEHLVLPDWQPHTPGDRHTSPELQQIEPQGSELLLYVVWHAPSIHVCPLAQQLDPHEVLSDGQLEGQLLMQLPLNELVQ
jgi:hypothetical protein